LRHTFASWALQNGVTLPELKELGSWKSYEMVLNYAHLSPDHLAKAADKVGTFRAQQKSGRLTSA
jgi:integrase